MSNNQPTFIFDWSGTITDNFPNIYYIYKKIAEELGQPVHSEEEVHRTFTIPYMKFWNTYFPAMTLEEEQKLYQKYLAETPPPNIFSNVKETLNFLKNHNCLMFVVSSDPKERLLFEAKRDKIQEHFTEIHTNLYDKAPTLQSIITKHNLDPKNTYYIGDTEGDIFVGKAVKVKTIGATYGFQPADIMAKAEPDILINDISELKNLILT